MNSSPSYTSPPVRSQPVKGRMPIWRKRSLWGLLAILIILPLSGALYQTFATQADRRNFSPPGQMVDVGGYRLHLHCIGENVQGRPTVILESGSGAPSASPAWAWLQPEVAQATRVCAYDRAGIGWSDPSPEPRDAQHIATELHRLLSNAGIPGPYVLVGWSYGGLYVRVYAGTYPEEVAGMVLLDSSHPDQWTSTPAGQAQYKSFARLYAIYPWLARIGVVRVIGLPDSGLPTPQREALEASYAATKAQDALSAEFLASPATDAQVRDVGSLDDMPLFVLTATEHGSPPEQEQLWQGWQNELALLSTNSIHQIVTGADHDSFWRDPETAKMSVAAILDVVEAVRTRQPLHQ